MDWSPPSHRIAREEEEEAPLAPPAGCRNASPCPAAVSCPAASCRLMPPLPFASCMPASPPVCPLFASWLLRHPCCCCRAVTASALRLCLNLFFAIWLSQLVMPHLLHRRCLLYSSHLCLATRPLRLVTRRLCLSTRRRLITGCVVAIA